MKNTIKHRSNYSGININCVGLHLAHYVNFRISRKHLQKILKMPDSRKGLGANVYLTQI